MRHPWFLSMFLPGLFMMSGCLAAHAHSLGAGKDDISPPIRAYLAQVNSLETDSELPEDAARDVRGVADLLRLWPANSELQLCFWDGDDELRKLFVDVIQRWLPGTSIQVDYGPAPRYRDCSPTSPSDIRVAFKLGGNWSFVGTESLTYNRTSASLNIGDAAMGSLADLDRAALEGVMLHEFGHALGLQHEHQSPEAHCNEEFDYPKIYQYAAAVWGWSKEKVDKNMKALAAGPRWLTTPYDPHSVMHYYFKDWMFKQGSAATCFVGHNQVLSATDKELIRRVYPASIAAQDRVLQDRADAAGAALASLKLDTAQVARVGVELGKVLAAGKRKQSLTFNLSTRETREAGGTSVATASCARPGTLPQGAGCKVAVDGSSFVISVDEDANSGSK